MQTLITNILLLIIAGGVGYLVGQGRPHWFGPEMRQRLLFSGWIGALLLAGAMRALALVYGPGAMFGLLCVVGGLILGIWLALHPQAPPPPRRR